MKRKNQTYRQRIEAIAKDRGISFSSARNFYSTVVLNDRMRIRRLLLKDGRSKPRYMSMNDFRKYGKVLTKGKNKGMTVIYVDTLKEKTITAGYAFILRRKFTINRVALFIQEIPKARQKPFWKFWPKYALKRKYLTPFEAKQTAKKIVELMYRDDDFFERLKQVLYE